VYLLPLGENQEIVGPVSGKGTQTGSKGEGGGGLGGRVPVRGGSCGPKERGRKKKAQVEIVRKTQEGSYRKGVSTKGISGEGNRQEWGD